MKTLLSLTILILALLFAFYTGDMIGVWLGNTPLSAFLALISGIVIGLIAFFILIFISDSKL